MNGAEQHEISRPLREKQSITVQKRSILMVCGHNRDNVVVINPYEWDLIVGGEMGESL